MAYYFCQSLRGTQCSRKINLSIFFCLFFASFPFGLKVGNAQLCGTMYSAAYPQESLPFLDQDESSNLLEVQGADSTGWNSTDTVIVEDDCKFSVCNDTSLSGSCHTLDPGSHSVDKNPFLGNAASANCSCVTVTESLCPDIYLKRSSCGRAYIEGVCRTCNALYTDLSEGVKVFPKEFADKVTALRLRGECMLKIYEDDEFKGEEMVINKLIVKDFKGTIGSYECVCDDILYLPSDPQPRQISYPERINIPASMNDIIQMKETDNYKYHPGLHAARRSYWNGRSSKNAYILVLGSAGAGKSSAINMLFDHPIVTNMAIANSSASDIQEFRIPVPVDELGIANSELRVIGTPGLGEIGLEHDAQVLATLDNY